MGLHSNKCDCPVKQARFFMSLLAYEIVKRGIYWCWMHGIQTKSVQNFRSMFYIPFEA
jgi:hypothetical protein